MSKFVLFLSILISGFIASGQIIEDFEFIEMNLINGDGNDLSTMTIVDNPLVDNTNPSKTVVKYIRDKDGLPNGGFWSASNIFLSSDNKYIHIKVLKPRISPVKFKLTGGPYGDLEVESIFPQTKVNEWEELVFDFSSLSGEYTGIAFMPDYVEPLNLSEDIEIYFDDIIQNNEPSVRALVTFNVDMTDSIASGWFNEETDQVWLASDIDGWIQPGSNAELQMLESQTNDIYTLNIRVDDGEHQYKYFRIINFEPSWDYGEWIGDPNRILTVTGNDVVLNDVFGEMPEKEGTILSETRNDNVIEDFEYIPLNLYLGGAEDMSSMTIVENPSPNGINTGKYVIQYQRDKDGVPGGGFWSIINQYFEENYVHIKVLKPRISALKFAIDIGEPNEKFSMYDQTKIGEWEDIVFDFIDMNFIWEKIAFMPDYEDPLTLTEDITIYFDDIIVNNDPNPITTEINEIPEKNTVRIFPNPCDDNLSYTSPNGIQEVIITNLTGQQQNCCFMAGQKNAGIDVSGLSPGLYFVRLKDSPGNDFVLKFIKE
jgi:hypothetical protein